MRARMAGFESGGFIDRSSLASGSQPAVIPGQLSGTAINGEEIQLIRDVRDLLSHLKNNGVKAPIVYSEIEKKRELMESSRNIGRK